MNRSKVKFGDARDNMPAVKPDHRQGMNYRSTMPQRNRAGMKKSGD